MTTITKSRRDYGLLGRVILYSIVVVFATGALLVVFTSYVSGVAEGVARAAVCDMVKPHFRQEDVCFGHEFGAPR